jgi:hypothetical protein
MEPPARSTLSAMKLSSVEASDRLAASTHGVLCTLHPARGPHPEPCLYATDGQLLAFAVEATKAREAPRLVCEDNLMADPRATLLVEHWDPVDWSKLWWVRAELRHVPSPDPTRVDFLEGRLVDAVEQFRDRPFDRMVVFDVVNVTGWAATAE